MLLSTIDFLGVIFTNNVFSYCHYTKFLLFAWTKPIAFSGGAVKAFTLLSTSSHSLDSYIWLRQVRINTKSSVKTCENIAKPFPFMMLHDAILAVWRLCNWSYNIWLLSF